MRLSYGQVCIRGKKLPHSEVTYKVISRASGYLDLTLLGLKQSSALITKPASEPTLSPMNITEYATDAGSLASACRAMFSVHVSPQTLMNYVILAFEVEVHPWHSLPEDIEESVLLMERLRSWNPFVRKYKIQLTEFQLYQKFPGWISDEVIQAKAHPLDPGFLAFTSDPDELENPFVDIGDLNAL